MPILNIGMLYTRAEMARALASASQLAHQPVAKIEQALDHVFDESRPSEDENETPGQSALYLAATGGFCTKLFLAYETTTEIMDRLGSVCCLCGDVGRHYQHDHEGFLEYVSPGHLRLSHFVMQRICYLTPSAPICRECSKGIFWRSRRVARPDEMMENLWDEGLLRLMGDSKFQSRVKKNVRVWDNLRFDPRQGCNS
jgi:hypothetical protein